MKSCLLPIALLLPCLAFAAPRECGEHDEPQLSTAQFTAAVGKGQRPAGKPAYLPPDLRKLHAHVTTRGNGKLTYRWLRDGKRMPEVSVNVGPGTWHSSSRLDIPTPLRDGAQLQILGSNGCLLREMTLPAGMQTENPAIQSIWQALAGDDATGARIMIKTLLETEKRGSAVARAAQRLLDVDLVLVQAEQRVRDRELFLVEESLKGVERRLAHNLRDTAARERIAAIRRDAANTRTLLAREQAPLAHAMRHLLQIQKLQAGDYPLAREDAEQLVAPVLASAAADFRMVDWMPTLRGYRLVLQDKRTGDTFEISPD